MPISRRVEILLDALMAEHYLPRPLLLELVDTLESGSSFRAAEAARDLLRSLDSSIQRVEFSRRLRRIRALAYPEPAFRPQDPAGPQGTPSARLP